MKKVDNGEEKKRKEKRKKKKKKKEKENNDVYSGHYVIASQPLERQPTGTPHARANWIKKPQQHSGLFIVDSVIGLMQVKSQSRKCSLRFENYKNSQVS